jgi:hypothetical protein
MQIQDLSLDRIDIYGGTQARVRTSDEAIASYAEDMENGAEFPPVTVYFDGADYWLADGFHRYLAAKRIEAASIRAEVIPGGRSDALEHALGANSTNGVYRTNEDKRNAVEIALEEWPDRANTVIAEICKVSIELVRKTRHGMEKDERIEKPQTVTGKDGRNYPAKIERQPRGKTEKSSSEEGGGGSGGGGKMSKKAKAELASPGGSNMEIEAEARSMIRKGEINPFELATLHSATAHDYAETVINLLGTMDPHDKKRRDGLLRIRRWIDAALAAPDAAESDDLQSVADAMAGEG